MKCPVCKTPDLAMSDRHGIEIDYCGTCRGVWLDRGELDKLIDRAMGPSASQSDMPARPQQAQAALLREPRHDPQRRDHWNGERGNVYGDRERRQPYKKKKSLLGEIFDFG